MLPSQQEDGEVKASPGCLVRLLQKRKGERHRLVSDSTE
jgi:hypothetical protein